MRKLTGVILAVLMVCPNVWAVDYTDNGKVIPTGYDGPAVSVAEVLGVGLGVAVLQNVKGPVAPLAVIPATVISWGAWRTDKHRPADVQLAIDMNQEFNAAQPVPGSIQELLQ